MMKQEEVKDNAPLETSLFKMGGGRFASELIFRYAGIWMALLCAVALAGLAFGIAVDLRWMVVGLMVVFIVIPMILAFCYYYFGLRRECYVNAFPHTLAISPRGVTATLHFISRVPKESVSGRGEGSKDAAGNKDANEETERVEKIVEEFFPAEALGRVRMGPSSFIVEVNDPERKHGVRMGRNRSKGFIWIPRSAFSDEDRYAQAFDTLNTKQ